MPAERLAVGNVEVLALTDQGPVDYNPFPLLNQLFPNVSLEAWAPYQQRYPEVFGGPNIWRTHYGCYLLRSQGRTGRHRGRERCHQSWNDRFLWSRGWAADV